MLCCVSRRAIAGVDQGPPYDHSSSKEQPVESKKVIEVKQSQEPDVPPILLPCAICARTFMPQSLEKHSKICERSTSKKRKPFDSAKQRIQGTELAEFLPRQERKRHSPDDRSSRSKTSWKETHDDFLRAIRAARNEIADSTMQKQCGTTVTPNAPTRANEQGMCPTCNRHFGVKAYDRHVAWCKERITRVPVSPATNIAKERLEARMKYRAPAVKSRRQATREKYSPGSAITLSSGNKTSPTLVAAKAKECASAPSCNKSSGSPVKQKPTVARRSGQTKESSSPTVPIKSRPMADRLNRPPEDEAGPATFRPAPLFKRTSHLPVPPLKHKRESLEECANVPSPRTRKQSRRKREKDKRNEIGSQRAKQDEKHQALHSARSLKANIVSARSQGNPKVNDVSINDEILGVTVKPCNIYRENQLTTWKQIGQSKDCAGNNGKNTKAQDVSVNTKFSNRKQRIEDLSTREKQLENAELSLDGDVSKEIGKLSSRSGSVNWTASTLNRTYSFRDKIEGVRVTKNKKWKPVRHSPRVEFCFGDPERTSRVHLSSISSGFVGETSLERDSRNSRRKEKKESSETGSLMYTMKDKSISNKVQSSEENLSLDAWDTKLSSEGFSSSRSRILEVKGLKGTASVDFSLRNNSKEDVPNTYSNFETVDSQKHLQGINAETRNLLDLQDPQITRSKENVGAIEKITEDNLTCLSKENFESPISSEQFAYLDEFNRFCETIELKSNELTSRSDRSNNEADETMYVENLKKHKEFNIDAENCVQSENELECPARSDNTDDDAAFYNTTTNWIEMESDPFLAEGILQPTRSSTPFTEECSNKNDDNYKNSKKESSLNPESSEWKVDIDTEKGSEMLYRVESGDSNYLSHSSNNKIDKFENNSANDISQYQNCSDGRRGELNKNFDSSRPSSPKIKKERRSFSRKQEESLSRIASPIQFPKIHSKEIASQINICNCSLEVSSHVKCEKGVGEACVNSSENASYSETQICTAFLDENRRENGTVELSEAQTRIDFNETNFNRSLNSEMEEGNHDCTKEYITKHDDLDNASKAKESSVKADVEDEELQELYKNSATKDFDCDSDDSIEREAHDPINDFKSSFTRNDRIKKNLPNLRSIVLSESCVKLSQRVLLNDSSTSRSSALKSRRSKVLEIENRIRENTSVLEESSDSLTSSIDATDLRDVKRVESVEVETIEEIGTRNRSIRFRILPEIKGTTVVVKENYDEKEKMNTQTYWEKASKASRNRLINLDPPCQGASRFLKRNPKVRILPPVPSSSSLINHSGKDYDPFLLAEQQMNDLLSDTSEQSATDGPSIAQNRDSSYPLTHSSAFVKYPHKPSLSAPEKRSSLIAPPTEFDDLTSDFSSDSTETNSLSREVFLKDLKENKELKDSISKSDLEKKSPVRELGRRVIIDKSKALGGDVTDDASRGSKSFVGSSERARKILDKVSPKVIRPSVNRSLSVRASSAPKTTPDRKISNSSHEKRSFHKINDAQRSSNNSLNGRNNNYTNLSSSNLSLSSIMSSDVDIKRSNSVFDELMTSFEDENGSFPSLKSLLKNDSLSVSSPVHGRKRNGQISDDELSSPESYKRQDHSKMSADSAYSSLNRKYSHHGRSTNDVAGRFDEDLSRNNRRDGDGVAPMPKCKMSNYCHHCGFRFPETAKFCCQCGIKRLVL